MYLTFIEKIDEQKQFLKFINMIEYLVIDNNDVYLHIYAEVKPPV